MNKKSSFKTQTIALIGVMAAMVFASCLMSIPINFSIGTSSRIHLGNIVILLAGLILGGYKGGLAAGVGAFLFDIVYPGYISSAPFTLISRFTMAFICGSIAHARGKKGLDVKYNILGAVLGCVFYSTAYFTKNFLEALTLIKGFWGAITTLRSGVLTLTQADVASALGIATQKGLISFVNAGIGIALSVPLCMAIRKALLRTNINI